MTRRHLLTAASSAALTSLVRAQASAGSAPIRIGNIGCGGRGSFVTGILKENPHLQLAAAADYFDDRVQSFGEKFGVPADRRFHGLDGSKKMLEHVDAIAIHSPPFFHVQQAIDAVAAGKHVLLAKPVAIDAAGCEVIRLLAKDAAAKGIVVYADVQCRGDEIFREGIQHLHAGRIGDLLFGECHYEADLIPLQSDADNTPEGRLKNWIRHRDLAGDIITEQNIHALDILSWAYGRPVKVSGISGRGGRPDNIGDVADHYALVFEFAKGAVTFASRQFSAWGSPFLCDNRFVGNKGMFVSKFAGRVMIRGNKDAYWAGGETKDLYRSGSVKNVAAFCQAILTKQPAGNTTVNDAVETTLLTLFGEHASKAGRSVTWDEFIRDAIKVNPDLTGLKA